MNMSEVSGSYKVFAYPVESTTPIDIAFERIRDSALTDEDRTFATRVQTALTKINRLMRLLVD